MSDAPRDDEGPPPLSPGAMRALRAWRRGDVGYRRAMVETGVASLPELHGLAAAHGIPVGAKLARAEARAAAAFAAAVREMGWTPPDRPSRGPRGTG